jgi:hypothetical protein
MPVGIYSSRRKNFGGSEWFHALLNEASVQQRNLE